VPSLGKDSAERSFLSMSAVLLFGVFVTVLVVGIICIVGMSVARRNIPKGFSYHVANPKSLTANAR